MRIDDAAKSSESATDDREMVDGECDQGAGKRAPCANV
jgi:hypothetical protein